MKAKATIQYNLFIAVVITVLFYAVTHKVYHLPFSYGDDHRALAMLHPEKVSENYKAAVYGYTPDLKGSFGIDVHIGRFRPLTWAYDELLCKICGDNTHLFRLSNLFILFLSSFFLLGIFTCFGVDRLSSLVVLAVYVFGRNNETWWTLIPPPQDLGEMLLLAGMFVWLWYRKKGVTGFYLLPAFLFLLADISKESFIFCIPVLLLTDYFFFNPDKKILSKEYLFSVLASLIPFSFLLVIVLHIQKIYAYSYPESIMSIAIYNIFQFVGGAAFFLAPLVAWFVMRKTITGGFIIKLVVVFAIWGIIQLVLLKGIKLDDQHHYLVPWLIYPFILTAIALSEMRNLSGKWFGVTCLAYVAAISLFAKNTYANTSSYTAQLQAYYNMMDTVKKDTAAPEIVYLGDNACLGDWINGTRVIMDNMGVKKELYFATTATSIPDWQKNYAEHSPQDAFKHMPLDSVFYPDGKWILFVEDPAKNGVVNDSIVFFKKDTVIFSEPVEDDEVDSGGNIIVKKGQLVQGVPDTTTLYFIKINSKTIKIPGKYYYFSVPYPGRSVGDILRGNFKSENRKGFYGIKLDDLRGDELMVGGGC